MTANDTGSDGSSTWLIGVVICVVAAVLSNFGLNLQKLAIDRSKCDPLDPSVRILWLTGLLGIGIGALCDFLALAFAPQSIVAPLGALTLPTNVILAPLMHGEKVVCSDLAWTSLIILGCVISVKYASHENRDYTEDELFTFFADKRFLLYMSSVVGTVLITLVLQRYIERKQKIYGTQSKKYMKWFKVHRFSYAAISGITGAQSILFAKAWMLLIKNHGLQFLIEWRFYILAISLASSISLQIYWLNCGLARWDALYNVPIFQSFWITVSVLGGGIVFNEFSDFDATQKSMFPFGVLLTVVGVFFLSQKDAEVEEVHSRRLTVIRGPEDIGENLLSGEENSITDSHVNESKSKDIDAVALEEGYKDFLVRFDKEEPLGIGMDTICLPVAHPLYSRIKKLRRLWEIRNILEGGAAGTMEPQIEVGDVIIEINGDSLLDGSLSAKHAMKRLRLGERPLIMKLRRYIDEVDDRTDAFNMGMTPAGASIADVDEEKYESFDSSSSASLLANEISSRGVQSVSSARAISRIPSASAPSSGALQLPRQNSLQHTSGDGTTVSGLLSSSQRNAIFSRLRSRSTSKLPINSLGYAVRRSHQSLRYSTMDPLLGMLHRGRAATAIPGSDREIHPLTTAVESFSSILKPIGKTLDKTFDLITGEEDVNFSSTRRVSERRGTYAAPTENVEIEIDENII
eukprot:g3891.t1